MIGAFHIKTNDDHGFNRQMIHNGVNFILTYRRHLDKMNLIELTMKIENMNINLDISEINLKKHGAT